MFYLTKGDQIRAAETFNTAARLVEQGWELTTKETYRAKWQAQDKERINRLFDAARYAPLLEREV